MFTAYNIELTGGVDYVVFLITNVNKNVIFLINFYIKKTVYLVMLIGCLKLQNKSRVGCVIQN